MDPNERLPGPPTVYDDLTTLPPSVALPVGVARTSKEYYVQKHTTRDGRTFYELYKRGGQAARPDGTYPPDPVVTTIEGPINVEQQERFKKEQATAAEAPPRVTIAGVPHERQPDGSYAPVQTAAGPATAGAAGPASGATVHIEGTPDPSRPGGFDNERPVKVVRDVRGQQVGLAVPLEGKDLQDWHEDRERSRNPGRLTDAEVAAAAKAAQPGAPTLKPDGKGGTVAVQVMPDGSIKTTPLPGVPSDAAATYSDVKQDPTTGAWTGLTKDGKWVPIEGGPGLAPKTPTIRQGADGRPDVQYVPDPKNPGQVIAVPIQGTGTQQVGLPPGFARPRFSPTETSAILGQTQEKLDVWVQQATDENDRRARAQKATELMAEAHKEATAYLNEQQIGTTTARDVYGNQVQERGHTISRQNQLTSTGGSMASQAVGSFLPMLRYAQAGAGDPARALLALMGLMNHAVGSMGGLGAAPANVTVPGILGPYLGAAGAPAAAPGVAPAAAAPGGPGAPAAAPAVAPAAAAPVLSPAAAAPRPWTDPATGPSVIQGAPAGALPAPAAAAPAPPVAAPPVRDDWRTNPGAPAAGAPLGPPDVYRGPPAGGHTADPGLYQPPPGGAADPGFFQPDVGVPQGMGGGGMPPLAIMQALLDRVEPLMQADPNWGVNDLAEIQMGRSPWG